MVFGVWKRREVVLSFLGWEIIEIGVMGRGVFRRGLFFF